MPLQPRVDPDIERLLFRSDIAAIGAFRCPATHRLFRDSGPASGHLVVFPRTSTTIAFAGGPAVTAGPPTVIFYNEGQPYGRKAIDTIDASDWFMIAPDVLREIGARYDPRAASDEKIFRTPSTPASADAYLMQRRLHASTGADRAAGTMAVEEAVIRLVDRVMADAARVRVTRQRTKQPDVERIEVVKRLIAARPASAPPLRRLAAAVEWSPYQLCRAFRAATGSTLTQYRHALRLRRALDRLRDPHCDLTTLALDLGYSSHSHFTASFRRHFGVPPSAIRRS